MGHGAFTDANNRGPFLELFWDRGHLNLFN